MAKFEEFRGRWIPVTEGLPDDDRDVLISVITERLPIIGCSYTFVHRLDLTHDGTQYTAWTDGEGYKFMDGEVTAWMELPEKYEDAKGEGCRP